MKKIILLILVVLLTGCGIKKVEMNHYEIDKIPYMFPLKYKQSNESNDYYHCYQLDKNNKITELKYTSEDIFQELIEYTSR